MSEEEAKNQRVVIPVTQEEYKQFLEDKTYLPDCLHVSGSIVPDCEGSCPKGLVCATFVYRDEDKGIDAEWYACAHPETLAQLEDRIVMVDEAQNDRKLKFLGFSFK